MRRGWRGAGGGLGRGCRVEEAVDTLLKAKPAPSGVDMGCWPASGHASGHAEHAQAKEQQQP